MSMGRLWRDNTMITTVKQYGEIRTGTNYLRALIQRNYPDIHVLSYILGGKHAPPIPFGVLWAEAQQAGGDAAFNFVSTATYSQRGGASHPKDPTQQEELTRRAPQIAKAYTTGALGFLVTIKDPYAWVVSAARFNGWIRGDEPLRDWSIELMREACLGYNRNYRAWLSFLREHPQRARLVRYEELLADPERVMTEIAAQFDWQRSGGFEAITAVVEPTQWDHLPVIETPDTFRPEFYANNEYLQRIPAEQMQQIGELMDWDLLSELGYARR
ncbi:MAG: hypothetical protein M0T70_11890 [Geobacteraceae bacterium]|nr:hypothetical protein [Geobacteraceae bacterium]